MTDWGLNSSVIFQHGRLERKELNTQFSSRRADSFAERDNRGGAHHIPGVSLSINFERYAYLQFSHGFNFWRQDRLCYPELVIMRLINDITDRENWQMKVNDFSVCRAWRDEAFAGYFPENNDLWEWCMCELRKKASDLNSSARAVFVFDSASRVCKSDRWVGSDLGAQLKLNTESVNLSPWMFPFVFGLSPIRTDGRHITRRNFLDSMTVGEVRRSANWDPDRLNNGDPTLYSGKSQWLATDVKITSKTGSATILSPINALHPVQHKSIYTAVEQLVPDVVGDWNQILLYKALARGASRIKPRACVCRACASGNFDSCSCRVEFREYSAWANGIQNDTAPSEWHEENWNPVLALDGIYSSSRRIYDNISLRDGFKGRPLQIYVEIATIKVDANGSVSPDSIHHLCWDLNGNRNERIVATTLLCLRRENIHSASGGISFRTETKRNVWEDEKKSRKKSNEEAIAGPSSAPAGPASAHAGPSSAHAGPSSAHAGPSTQSAEPDPDERMPTFQELGTVQLPEGRVVTYPNALQHKFEAPKLKEPAKTGYLQFMQIHLVDPHYAVCSTRFVPPQSLEWWKEAVRYETICLKNGLPSELSHVVLSRLLVPDKWLNRRKRVRGLQNYWQTYHRPIEDNEPDLRLCQPPITDESAFRRKKQALQKHESIIRAVNGPKIYGRAKALTIWVQTVLRSRSRHRPNPANILLPPTGGGGSTSTAGGSTLTAGGSALTAGGSVDRAPDIEEENLPEWDDLLDVDSSSGSEGSTDAEDKSNPLWKGKGLAVDDSDDSSDDVDSDGETFFDAQYGLTLAELAANQAETPTQTHTQTQVQTQAQVQTEAQAEMAGPAEVEEEIESLYDDAMSRADELEDEELGESQLDEYESGSDESAGDESSAWEVDDSEMSGLEASDAETIGPGENGSDSDEMAL